MGDVLPAVDLGRGRSAKFLVAGYRHTCAILDNNDIKCWGHGYFGELGYGDTDNRGDDSSEMGDVLPAVDLGRGRSAKFLVAGERHTCAILDNNDVKCWGYGYFGRLGYGDIDNRGDGSSEMGDV